MNNARDDLPPNVLAVFADRAVAPFDSSPPLKRMQHLFGVLAPSSFQATASLEFAKRSLIETECSITLHRSFPMKCSLVREVL